MKNSPIPYYLLLTLSLFIACSKARLAQNHYKTISLIYSNQNTIMEKINWSNVHVEQVNPKMKRQFIHGEKIMIAKMEFEDGFTVPWHSHENEQITEVFEGILRFWFDDNE